MTERRAVDAFLAGDAAAVTELLGPEACFHSPAADYRGPERVRAVLTALATVVAGPAATSVLERPGEVVAFFTAEIDGQPAEGVVRAAGPDLTLMIRPLKTLLLGVERMQRLL